MNPITSAAQLREIILQLESDQVMKGQILTEQFHQTLEDLKPLNIAKRTIVNMTSSPFLIENILGNVIGFASGFVSKKIVTGTSANIFRKLAGSLVQISITNTVKQHPETIKSIGHFILQHLFRQKTMNSPMT